MTSEFRPNILITDDNVMISLKCVESIGPPETSEDLLVNKLKDDITMKVVMSSGNTYSISVKHQMDTLAGLGVPESVSDAHTSILEKWIRLLGQHGNIT